MKRKKPFTRLLNFKLDQDPLKESFENFKDRVQHMPLILLLQEHRFFAEQYGIVVAKTKLDWGERHSAIFNRLSYINDEILKKYHSTIDQAEISEYYNDRAWKEKKKEKKNVKVSKKLNKQSK